MSLFTFLFGAHAGLIGHSIHTSFALLTSAAISRLTDVLLCRIGNERDLNSRLSSAICRAMAFALFSHDLMQLAREAFGPLLP